MRSFLKFIAFLSIIPILIGLFFFSNIKGYFRFKDYCETEGGLQVYESLNKNMGWLVKDKQNAKMVSRMSHVGFTRYANKSDEKNYDVRYLGGEFQGDDSYEIKISDENLGVSYRWENNVFFVDEKNRIKKGAYEIFRINDNKKLAIFTVFYYSPYGGSLGGPDWRVCANKSATDEYFFQSLASIFKN